MSRAKRLWHSGSKDISVVVDNDSWILPYAKVLVEELRSRGHSSVLCREHSDISEGDICFYLGCVNITPQDILELNSYNLVVHESSLPLGRGFAPMTWQVLEGKKEVPISLIEAAQEVDAGLIYFEDKITLEGHELCDELRAAQGIKTVQLCLRFCTSEKEPVGRPQEGEPTYYSRRRPKDSELDINKSVAEQFNLLRVVDNERYPAFFIHRNNKYKILITKS